MPDKTACGKRDDCWKCGENVPVEGLWKNFVNRGKLVCTECIAKYFLLAREEIRKRKEREYEQK